MDCALVLGENLTLHKPPTYPNDVVMDNIQERIIRNELTDATHLIHCDSGVGYLVDQVMHLLESFDKINSFKLHSPADMGMLAFLLWNEMNKFGHPRPPHHAASALNTTTSHMQKAERMLAISPTYCPPSEYVFRICGELGLGSYFSICKIIKEAVVAMDHVLFKPENVIAGVIMQLRKELENENVREARCVTTKKGKTEQSKQLEKCAQLLLRADFPLSLSEALHVPRSSMENMRVHLNESSKKIITEKLKGIKNQLI